MARNRIRRGFPVTYDWWDKVLEDWFLPTDTSEEIAASIRSEVVALTERGQIFAGRYADLEAFDSVAPFMDWRALLGFD